MQRLAVTAVILGIAVPTLEYFGLIALSPGVGLTLASLGLLGALYMLYLSVIS